MLKVFFTIDTEVWPDPTSTIYDFDWYYETHILGKTSKGEFGLPYQLKRFNDLGFVADCYVEPHYTDRYGIDSLKLTLKLIDEFGADIHLHTHPEYSSPEGVSKLLGDYPIEQQQSMLKSGAQLLEKLCGKKIISHRAGNFGANLSTLKALSNIDIKIDTSFNRMFPMSNQTDDSYTKLNNQFLVYDDVLELPITVFNTFVPSISRLFQLCACSLSEMKYCLLEAVKKNYLYVVIVSHSFELLRRLSSNQVDSIVLKRFDGLCKFLDKNRDKFELCGIRKLSREIFKTSDKLQDLRVPFWSTSNRYIEQAMRRSNHFF